MWAMMSWGRPALSFTWRHKWRQVTSFKQMRRGCADYHTKTQFPDDGYVWWLTRNANSFCGIFWKIQVSYDASAGLLVIYYIYIYTGKALVRVRFHRRHRQYQHCRLHLFSVSSPCPKYACCLDILSKKYHHISSVVILFPSFANMFSLIWTCSGWSYEPRNGAHVHVKGGLPPESSENLKGNIKNIKTHTKYKINIKIQGQI